jgi:H+-translocating NAD(P) transhydrogenase subunit alpha
MQIGIPKELLTGENRVACSPSSVAALITLGYRIIIQSGAGTKASFADLDFVNAGADIVEQMDCWQADIVLKVNAPTLDEIALAKSGGYLISFIAPAQNNELILALQQKSITALAMDMVPRMTRSQSIDALSAMANIAGYRAVIEASHHFGRFFTGQITAAGNIAPAKVMVIGAGVAGLAAIGTASSLGAIVRAFDTRPEVREQIESMGAEFLVLDYQEPEQAGTGDGYAKEMSQAFIDAEMALFAEQAADVDIIITTAMIPGRPAPKLLTKEMVGSMKTGSIIVDLAAAGGGNCELTNPGKLRRIKGVTIIGYTDLVSRLPNQASQLYANNVLNLLKLISEKSAEAGTLSINIDFDDPVIRNMTVVKQQQITFPPPAIQVSATPVKPVEQQPVPIAKVSAVDSRAKARNKYLFFTLLALLFVWLASVAPAEFLSHFTVFSLSCVVGYHLVWNVTHALHTPLMSVTNAISGIIVLGALLQVSSDNLLVHILAAFAVLIASINIFGGFFVTNRMLKMFRK